MQYRELHPWYVSVTEAQRIQQHLRHSIQVGTYAHDIRTSNVADIAIVPTTPAVYAGVVVLDYTTLAVVERQGIMTTTAFPYIPGLLSFREAPVALHLTVVMSTSAQSGVAMHAMAARAAWVASNAAAAHDTTTGVAHSSNAP